MLDAVFGRFLKLQLLIRLLNFTTNIARHTGTKHRLRRGVGSLGHKVGEGRQTDGFNTTPKTTIIKGNMLNPTIEIQSAAS